MADDADRAAVDVELFTDAQIAAVRARAAEQQRRAVSDECSICGRVIEPARREALPGTPHCAACANRAARLGRLYAQPVAWADDE